MDKKAYTAIFLLLLLLMLTGGYYAYKRGVFNSLQSKPQNNSKEESKESDKPLGLELKTNKDLLFSLDSPKPNSKVGCEFQIIGNMPNVWFSKGSFPVEVIVNDKVVYTTKAYTEGDLSTEGNLPFTATVKCQDLCVGSGLIVLKRSNPSDLEENNDSYAIPVIFDTSCSVIAETMKLKVFFSSTKEDPNSLKCEVTYPVERNVTKTVAVGRAALLELLKGPTKEEASKGYTTGLPEGVELKSLNIKDGVAYVDFNNVLGSVGGSCITDRIRSQIEKTLMQFPTVKSVKILVDGKTEGVLES